MSYTNTHDDFNKKKFFINLEKKKKEKEDSLVILNL